MKYKVEKWEIINFGRRDWKAVYCFKIVSIWKLLVIWEFLFKKKHSVNMLVEQDIKTKTNVLTFGVRGILQLELYNSGN